MSHFGGRGRVGLSCGRRVATAASLTLALLVAGCAASQPKLSIKRTDTATRERPEPAPIAPAVKAAAEKEAVRAAQIAKAEADPNDARAAILAARTLKGRGQGREALALLTRSAEANPKHGHLQREIGLICAETGRLPQAIKHLQKAIALGVDDWQTRSALGVALAASGKHPEAQLAFAKALEMKPDHPSILNNLALSYALDRKPAEAEKVLRIAAATKGHGAQVAQNLALVLGIRGNLVEARKVTDAALPPDKATANAAYLKKLAAAPQRTARTDTGLPKPYLLGVGAPKD